MKTITCPDSMGIPSSWKNCMIFLGGGITNCPDWQQDMISLLSSNDDGLVLFNPRRSQFDVSDASQSDFQIQWEYEHLHQSDAIIFWFPKETLCPITLYELGAAATRGDRLFVGCHPDYQRKFDVIKQLSLVRPDIVVRTSIEEIATDVTNWYRN